MEEIKTPIDLTDCSSKFLTRDDVVTICNDIVRDIVVKMKNEYEFATEWENNAKKYNDSLFHSLIYYNISALMDNLDNVTTEQKVKRNYLLVCSDLIDFVNRNNKTPISKGGPRPWARQGDICKLLGDFSLAKKIYTEGIDVLTEALEWQIGENDSMFLTFGNVEILYAKLALLDYELGNYQESYEEFQIVLDSLAKRNIGDMVNATFPEGVLKYFYICKKIIKGNFMAIDISNFRYHSSDHIRYQDGRDVSGHNKGCNRGIEIKKHPEIDEAFLVTIYNLDGKHPLWGDNIQMAAKRMKVIKKSETEIELRGFGNDPLGFPFSGYGLVLHVNNNDVERVVLHMFDKNVDIEYLK